MIGPGKYDDAATVARTATAAEGVLLIVVNGSKGSGFSAQLSAELTLRLPAILREVADEIERSGPTAV